MDLIPKQFSLKTIILVAICLQNASYTLLRKYSTMTENVSSKEILLVSEILKVIAATYLTLVDTEQSSAQGKGIHKLKWLILNSGKMFLLAVIYGAMNILSFVALQYIGAGEFTICAQLKILTTAGFSVLILKTSLSTGKWRALVLLVLGCILVASPSFSKTSDSLTPVDNNSSAFKQLFGFGAVLLEVVLSGFASIYFEKVVKNTTEVVSIWERNFQLGFYSIAMYACIIFYESFHSESFYYISTSTPGPWSNWSSMTLLVSILGATGGLLVAATLKYADSILKTLATAGAIVISTLLGHYLLQGPMDLVVVIGGLVAIIAITNYMFDYAAPCVLQSSTCKQGEASVSSNNNNHNSSQYFSDKKKDSDAGFQVDGDVEDKK